MSSLMFATPEFLTKSISAANDGIINHDVTFFTVSPLRNVIAYITLPRIMQIKAQCLTLFNSLVGEYRRSLEFRRKHKPPIYIHSKMLMNSFQNILLQKSKRKAMPSGHTERLLFFWTFLPDDQRKFVHHPTLWDLLLICYQISEGDY